MDRWKSRGGKSQRKRKSPKKEHPGARKGRKVAKHCVFPLICGSGGSKSRLAKAAGAEPMWSDERWKVARHCGAKHISKSKCIHFSVGARLEVEMSKKCTPLWREAHFQVEMYKTLQCRSTFGSWDVEKVHAVVARSTSRSQNAQNTPGSDHVWKLPCRKSARCCGAKHIWKSKCTKHFSVGARLEVEMSKTCTPLWREAHLEVKMYKAPQRRRTFGSWDVEKAHAVMAQSKFPRQNVQSTSVSEHVWKLRCRKSARRGGAKHISKSICAKHLGVGACLEVEMSKKSLLWREAHFEAKSVKADGFEALLEVDMSKKCMLLWREVHFEVKKCKRRTVSEHFWKLTCWKSACRCGAKSFSKSKV